MGSMDHYEATRYGAWTFSDDTTAQPIVFRKGSPADSVSCPSESRECDADDSFVAVSSSEWGSVNVPVLAKMLDIVNEWERNNGPVVEWE